MGINLALIKPAVLKAKEVATVDYVDNSYTQLQTTLQSLATSEEARDCRYTAIASLPNLIVS